MPARRGKWLFDETDRCNQARVTRDVGGGREPMVLWVAEGVKEKSASGESVKRDEVAARGKRARRRKKT